MARSFEDLRKLSKEDLIIEYDRLAKSTSVGLSFLADEIQRRETQEANERIVNLTSQMRNMTGIITFLTLVNVAVFLFDYFL